MKWLEEGQPGSLKGAVQDVIAVGCLVLLMFGAYVAVA